MNVIVKKENEKTEEQVPTLVTFREFMNFVRKKILIENLGGFSYWMQQQGMPPKWPVTMWKAKLEEYLNRKL